MTAGLELIYEHGYEAVSLRQLAAAVGVQSGSLYNHIKSKQDLLVTLVVRHLEDLLSAADKALEGVDDPDDALRTFIEFHLTYHISRKREIYIANSELRSLNPENRKGVVELRRAYEQKLIDILKDMSKRGRLRAPDTRVTAYAMLSMLTGVANWFRPDGALRLGELVHMHTDLIFNGLAAPVEAKAAPAREARGA